MKKKTTVTFLTTRKQWSTIRLLAALDNQSVEERIQRLIDARIGRCRRTTS